MNGNHNVETPNAHDQILEDRQILLCLTEGEPGWKLLEKAGREFGHDPLHLALSAIARELVRTTINLFENETHSSPTQRQTDRDQQHRRCTPSPPTKNDNGN